MGRFVDEQANRNRNSSSNWAEFTEHRQQVTNLICQHAPAGDSAALILGAGNCNDLDLHRLLNHFRQATLVDIDKDALRQGPSRQGLVASPRLELLGGTDVTGVFDRFSQLSSNTTDAELDDLLGQLESYVPPWPTGRYELAVSVCTLSQLLEPIIETLGPNHPRFVEFVNAIRSQHFRILAQSLLPHGRGLLITDVVSTETCPDLVAVPRKQLRTLVVQLVSSRNFFHGLNPFRILQLMRSSDPPYDRLANPQFADPWVWHFGPRSYLVCGFAFEPAAEN